MSSNPVVIYSMIIILYWNFSSKNVRSMQIQEFRGPYNYLLKQKCYSTVLTFSYYVDTAPNLFTMRSKTQLCSGSGSYAEICRARLFSLTLCLIDDNVVGSDVY